MAIWGSYALSIPSDRTMYVRRQMPTMLEGEPFLNTRTNLWKVKSTIESPQLKKTGLPQQPEFVGLGGDRIPNHQATRLTYENRREELSLRSVFHVLQRFLNAGREGRASTSYESFHASELFSCFT